MLHIGNDRVIPKRNIVAVLDVRALRRARCGVDIKSIDSGGCEPDSIRSVIVCEHKGRELLYGSPISTMALRSR